MLRKISDSINHCVKCDDETRYLIWAFNHDLVLQPVCWRCFARADQHINTKPNWKRLSRAASTVCITQTDGRQTKKNNSMLLIPGQGGEQLRRAPSVFAAASVSSAGNCGLKQAA